MPLKEKADLELFYSPRACSVSCHIALEESGLEYSVRATPVRQGANKTADYLALNPTGKIPVFRVGSEIITEAHAILTWIGDNTPGHRLLPAAQLGSLDRVRAHEWMNYLSSTVHIAFRPFFRPADLVGEEGPIDVLQQVGGPRFKTTMLDFDRRLKGREYALGDGFSVVDGYCFIFYIWSRLEAVREWAPAMPNAAAHALRMLERETVRTVIDREGFELPAGIAA
jgi:glutathione S-transferase